MCCALMCLFVKIQAWMYVYVSITYLFLHLTAFTILLILLKKKLS